MRNPMARLTVSLPQNIARAASKKARIDRRSVSAYVAKLIEDDVASGAPESLIVNKARALETLGLDPVEILTTAAEQKLTSEATA